MDSLERVRCVGRLALFIAATGLVPAGAWGQPLEEIVVTATKREQTLQEAPVAVSVVSDVELQQGMVLDLSDLQVLVPSLRVQTFTGTTAASFAVRGFGNGIAIGAEPAVGMFVDGVFRSRPTATMLDLPRLDRVEVLRGPQSTIFGKNASAGVVSIVTPEPSRQFESQIDATFGRFDQRVLRGYVSGPVSDAVALSFSGVVNQRDGYANAPDGIRDQNDKDRWAARFQALFEPTDSMSFRLIADLSELDESCCATGNILSGGTEPLIQALGGQIRSASGDEFAYESLVNFDRENKVEDGGVSLHAEVAFPQFTLTSITAYRNNKQGPQTWDTDFTSLDLASGTITGDIETVSQELRLTSSTDGPLGWMVGAFLFDETIDLAGCSNYGESLREYLFALTGGNLDGTGGPLGLLESLAGTPGDFLNSDVRSCSQSGQDNVAYSAFGTVDYEFSDRLRGSLGANYTRDDKEVFYRPTENNDNFSALNLSTFMGGAFAALSGLQLSAPGLAFPNVVEDGESSDSETTWQATLSWDLNDNVTFYARAATGFKSSSWSIGASNPSQRDQAAIEAAGIATSNQFYGSRLSDPEHATVYEVGVKANFQRGYAYLTVFDQSIEDFQTRAYDGVRFIQANAGELSIEGVELDLLYAPTDNWRFTLGATFLDPIYEDYRNAPGPFGGPPVVDRSGTKPGGIHDMSAVATIVYSFTIGRDWSGFARAEYLYERDAGVDDSFPNISREIGTANASAGLDFNNGVSTVLWVRNLNEDEYFTGAFNGVAQPGTVNSFLSEPRTYGVTLSYAFD